eukprot:Gb_30392 [translate_table: standard]
MELTEEQRRRAEANRLAALAKRQAAENHSNTALPGQRPVPWQINNSHEGNSKPWNLFPCRKIVNKMAVKNVAEARLKNMVVVLELCTAREFSVSAKPAPGSTSLSMQDCFKQLQTCLSSVRRTQYNESEDDRSIPMYLLKDYELVLKTLKKFPDIQLQQIPWSTLAVVRQCSLSSTNERWLPSLPNHISDDEVDRLLVKLPSKVKEELLPFQMDGVRFGVRRGGRCLIADEMGVGKTIQAIAIASCYMHEGSILVVCPASMRFTWAEELERWLPFCVPIDIHLVFGHRNNLADTANYPKIVVISYTMLSRLRKSMLVLKWALMIVDESHNLRCTKKFTESEETKAVLDVARTVKRVVLLSGTPSLSRPYDIFHQIDILWPGLLGKDKYDFARNYCCMESVQVSQGRSYKDFSKGIRLQELNVLLRETVMVRRLKQNVLAQLPPKRRQVIRVMLSLSDISLAKASAIQDDRRGNEVLCQCGFTAKGSCDCEDNDSEDASVECENSDDLQDIGVSNKSAKCLSYQEIGLGKLRSFQEWLFNHPIFTDSGDTDLVEKGSSAQKMVVFAHHLRVLDGIQEAVCQKGLEFVRIDGSTLTKDRQLAVQAFRLRAEVKIAIIGITAGGVGLDFSSAQSVAFVELPKSASEMIQAEDRAHRRGQKNAVNIYVFCAKDTSDESQWQTLNKSLERISTMINGIDDAIPEIEVDAVYDLDLPHKPLCTRNMLTAGDKDHGHMGSIVPVSSKEDDTTADGNNALELPESSSQPLLNMDSDAPSKYGYENGQMQADNMGTPVSKEIQCGPNAENEGDGVSNFPPESLMFEVSPNTGRIHLYVCVFDKDLRPRQLEENFRPEDLESFDISESAKRSLPKCMHESLPHREIAVNFIKEWNSLRPVERNKLFGRPLRLPLCRELSCIKAGPLYSMGGLLKGGSRRRVAPRDEISYPLPEHATWRKIFLCKHYRMKERHEMQGWTAEGEPLCKLCQNPCLGSRAKTPEYFEDLFCKLSCFEEYRMRTSQQSLREAVFSIEHGICTQCKLDCHKLVQCIRPLSVDQRREHILKAAPDFAKHQRLLDKLALEPAEGNAWHADHIVPVYRGGGECRLENMRTLCVICHSKITVEQQRDRRMMRARAKDGLYNTIEKFIEQVCQKRMKLSSQVHPCAKVEDSSETDDDKELLIDVSGSAYSEKPISLQFGLNESSKIDDNKEVGTKRVSESAYSEKPSLPNEPTIDGSPVQRSRPCLMNQI